MGRWKLKQDIFLANPAATFWGYLSSKQRKIKQREWLK